MENGFGEDNRRIRRRKYEQDHYAVSLFYLSRAERFVLCRDEENASETRNQIVIDALGWSDLITQAYPLDTLRGKNVKKALQQRFQCRRRSESLNLGLIYISCSTITLRYIV